jgi:two-component system, chemotaxis family, protein-glutamate methylesterase/glutaminase
VEKKNIVVIGASAGGFEAIKKLVSLLPSDLNAAIFIVWHMSAEVRGILPNVINRQKKILAANAIDGEPIVYNRIYVAPPDHHLLLEKGIVRITKGPKENRFRPAVDPLFRSAAQHYGSRVIGIVLSGALNDGSAGLWTIKNRGGTTVIQDPLEAEVPSMPQNALAAVDIDHCIRIEEMSLLLQKLVEQTANDFKQPAMEEINKTNIENRIAAQEDVPEEEKLSLGKFTPYACPDCHGVLSAIRDGNIVRYRCHTGHAFSADSLLASISENIEDTLWSALRGLEESNILLNNLGDHFAHHNQPKLAALYFKKATEADSRAKLIRQVVFNHEQLSTDAIGQEAKETEEG